LESSCSRRASSLLDADVPIGARAGLDCAVLAAST
jgi:hypothetical protein